MVSEVARRKAIAVVLEKARVTDASGRVVDLSTLFADEEQALEEEPGDEPQASVPPVTTSAASDPTALPAIAVADFEPDDAKA